MCLWLPLKSNNGLRDAESEMDREINNTNFIKDFSKIAGNEIMFK